MRISFFFVYQQQVSSTYNFDPFFLEGIWASVRIKKHNSILNVSTFRWSWPRQVSNLKRNPRSKRGRIWAIKVAICQHKSKSSMQLIGKHCSTWYIYSLFRIGKVLRIADRDTMKQLKAQHRYNHIANWRLMRIFCQNMQTNELQQSFAALNVNDKQEPKS